MTIIGSHLLISYVFHSVYLFSFYYLLFVKKRKVPTVTKLITSSCKQNLIIYLVNYLFFSSPCDLNLYKIFYKENIVLFCKLNV